MKSILVITAFFLSSLAAQAQVANQVACHSGGFAYNDLHIIEAGETYLFTTNGIGLNVVSDQLEEKDYVYSASFMIPKSKCQGDVLKDESLLCRFRDLDIKLSLNGHPMETDHKEVVEVVKSGALVINRLPGNGNNTIKLLITRERGVDELVVSNYFKYCQ